LRLLLEITRAEDGSITIADPGGYNPTVFTRPEAAGRYMAGLFDDLETARQTAEDPAFADLDDRLANRSVLGAMTSEQTDAPSA
jgi:hypothetical protein